ncbi:ferredoxin [Kineosporia sp. J2-2]|uniref:Ferredoxin n=1 Tax=Kineosporia corallincola TaxID=2835133 RepID=A0ABS5TPL7_9ACTN|nr:ferredoxin [Kineosporia corallincola]MBT0773041.1 ferredoxin [Kineosporia corallincola]
MTRPLVVDWTACRGRGLCADLLPELLTQDHWGFPENRSRGPILVPDELEGPARRAVRMCPALALRLDAELPGPR